MSCRDPPGFSTMIICSFLADFKVPLQRVAMTGWTKECVLVAHDV